MKRDFHSNQVIPIDAGGPSQISSTIDVTDISGHIRDVNVTVDIDHSFTDDLRISLVAPDDSRVLLVAGEGGRDDNFRRTVFDDSATETISGARAPFRGTFRPEESLTAFKGKDAEGTWRLLVEDTAFQDGGTLKSWSLSLETCSHVFDNNVRVPIDTGPANTIRSTIEVADLGGLVVEDVTVLVDIDHTWDDDLKVTLIGPDATSVVLVNREGGDRDGFNHTTFDDTASKSITEGAAPFTGSFRPEEPLAAFQDKLVSGVWTLEIEDQASQDGGMLNRWQLNVHSCEATPRVDTQFNIELEFVGGLSVNQRSVFTLAAARWAEVIVGDLPSATTPDGRVIDDVLILAEGKAIDGRLGTLGSAGPRRIRSSKLPFLGEMTFDTADLADMERQGTFIDVILHEMGHVLGIGTLWNHHGLLRGSGTNNPEFTGVNAMAEYAQLLNENAPRAVPVANTGGAGTAEGHWRELTFDHELMTGFVERGEMPLSRMTVASLKDLGYEVDINQASPYQLPTAAAVARRSAQRHTAICHVTFPEFIEVPDDG